MNLFKNLWTYVIFVFIMWGLSWLLLIKAPGGEHGTFGDMFGAVNALFSGLAFVGVIYALFQQMEGLKMQKDELELQRNELRETREEFKIQNETLKRQRFENTFFNLISQHFELIKNLSATISSEKMEGRYLLYRLRLSLMEYISNAEYEASNKTSPIDKITQIKKQANDFFQGHESKLYHFFKSFRNILIFISNSTLINEEEKPLYANQFSNLMSIDEEIILIYYLLSDRISDENLVKLVANYKIISDVKKLGLGEVSLELFNSLGKE